jgi:D-amino-acid dehydrogenase
VAVTEDELAHFGALVAALGARRAQHGYPTAEEVREVSPDDARALFPPLARPLRALHDRTAARVDGRLLNQALLKAAAGRKVTYVRASADRLMVEGGRAVGIATGAEVHRAGSVIIAGGAWTPELAGPLGVTIAVAPQRGQIIHLQVPGMRHRRLAGGARLPRSLHRLVGRGAGGGGRHSRDGLGLRSARHRRGSSRGARRSAARGPGPGRGRHAGDACGPAAAVGGWPARRRPGPGVVGAYVATGHGPSGLTLGPYSAALVTELVLGRAPALDLTPFRADRFAAAR